MLSLEQSILKASAVILFYISLHWRRDDVATMPGEQSCINASVGRPITYRIWKKLRLVLENNCWLRQVNAEILHFSPPSIQNMSTIR